MAEVPYLGIDLGTTNSCVAFYNPETKSPEVIPNHSGKRTTPSVVFFSPTDDVMKYGIEAQEQHQAFPKSTIYDAKRLIGRNVSDPQFKDDRKKWTFAVVEKDGKSKFCYTHNNKEKTHSPETISGFFLTHLKNTAENSLGKECPNVTITVPAYFDNLQRDATKRAGTIAGFKQVQIFNEPTAAAISYGIDLSQKEKHTVFVFDFGGGTVDTSILEVDGNNFRCISVSGDSHLGGEDIDNLLMDFFITKISKQKGHVIAKDEQGKSKLKAECEKIKKKLTEATECRIRIEKISPEVDLDETINIVEFNQLISGILDRCKLPIEDVLNRAKKSTGDITDLILVGGSSRIPAVRELLKGYFTIEPKLAVNPDEAVALGAAILSFNTFSQGTKITDSIKIFESSSLSIGLRGAGGKMVKLIEHSTPLPAECVKKFSTTKDGQTEAKIQIFEGERAQADNNTKIGEFILKNLPQKPAKQVEFDIKIRIEIDNTINVTATVTDGSISKSYSVENHTCQLSKEELDKLVKEAEDNAIVDNLQMRFEVLHQELKTLLKTLNAAARKANDIEAKTEIIENRSKIADLECPSKTEEIEAFVSSFEKQIEHFKYKYGYLIK